MKYIGPHRPRYVRQKDDYGCGPIAVLNALKWAGYDAQYKRDYARLIRLCKCTKGGTIDDNFNKAIRQYKRLLVYPRKNPMYAPPISLVDACLDDGGAVAMGFIYKYAGVVVAEHFTLCVGKVNKRYVFINNIRTIHQRTVTLQNRRTVVKMLRFSDEGCRCSVWFLHRRSK
jgi:hypothetical protein